MHLLPGNIFRLAATVGAVSVITAVSNMPSNGQTNSSPSVEKLKADYRRPYSIPFPKENPYTATKAALGKSLYFDTRLSGANLLSCASCHSPAYGWGDGQPKGVGHGMKQLGRRSPTIVNAAYGQVFMWDGRAPSLEEQALGPIKTDVEMNMPVEKLIEKLQGIVEYGPLFQAAFPGEGMSLDHVAKAIATYERTVVSGYAPFDAWIDGNEKAISPDAKRGFALFNAKAACAKCHSGWNFTDDSFHDIGLPDADIGRGKFLPNVVKMQQAFKTPGLREISRRGPYMHNGSIATIDAVIDHYNDGGINRPSRSALIQPLGLTKQEKSDLVAFLKTLTSDMDPTIVPTLPR
ncbi:MAG TPA: cytochrome c peroxidase [Xanthobacteraceae bacterium]|nr:cytochrome c peroxidase [Xanthobacteraceae bacterium]